MTTNLTVKDSPNNTLAISSRSRQFNYDAVSNKGRRRAPTVAKRAEGKVLKKADAKKLQATIYDLVRNDPAAAWTYNKFLDHTTTFHFQSNTGNAEFDTGLERAMERWSRKRNCDITGRDDLQSMIRCWGSGIALDGDSMLVKLSGYQLQGIESDRITNKNLINEGDSNIPDIVKELSKSGVDDGLIVDKYGRVMQYVVCRRSEKQNTSFVFDQLYNAEDIIFDGNFFRFDQRRGVSPFASAVNIFQDIKEIDEAQLIKCKKHAMHGIAIYSDAEESGYNESHVYDTDGDDTADAEESEMQSGPRYDFELDAGLKLELEPGDKIDMFESKTPSQEYKEYSQLMLRKGMLSFFVPFTFFDSSGTSYSTMRQDRAEFRISIAPFRRKCKAALTEIAEWVIPHLIKKYRLKVPENFSIDTIPFEWVPQAEIYLDEGKEVDAALKRIAGGLSDLPTEHRRRGTDFYDSARNQAQAIRYVNKTPIRYFTINGQPLNGGTNEQESTN
jgi:capsid protein